MQAGPCTLARSSHAMLHFMFDAVTLSHMVQCYGASLDRTFAALADTTRRAVLDQLKHADASITDLANGFGMTLTGMKKHIAVLERAALVATEKVGRVRMCRLGPHGLAQEAAWIEQYRQLWEARFADLDSVVDDLIRRESFNDPER